MRRYREINEPRLTPDEVREVRKQYALGAAFKQLASYTGASRNTLRKAVYGIHPYDGIPSADTYWRRPDEKPLARRAYVRKIEGELLYSFWNGSAWCIDRLTPKAARNVSEKSLVQSAPWRRV